MDDLSEIKAGDEVVFFTPNAMGYGNYGLSIERVERTTATQIIVGGRRFRRATGMPVGGELGWSHSRIEAATLENRVRVAHQRETKARWTRMAALRSILENLCDHLDWLERLSPDTMGEADRAVKQLWAESAKEGVGNGKHRV